MAAQWSSVDRWWIGPCRCSSPSPPLPPFRAAALALPRRSRRAAERKNGAVRVGCASVPRELATAAEAELPSPVAVENMSTEEEDFACEECVDMGWVVCDFCKGKKNNVKPEGSTRVYRRCPTCKAAGFVLCPRCKVYKCITFPDSNES